MTKFELNDFLPFRLNRLAAEFSRRMHHIYGEEFGIDIPEWRTLVTLGSQGPMTAQHIVSSTRTNKSTISRAVHKLEERGWIGRLAVETDRRNYLLSLTDEGKTVYDQIVPKVLAVEKSVLDKMGRKQKSYLETIAALEQIMEIGRE